jgi:hypothetical protein
VRAMTTCGARVSPHSTSCKLSTVWGALTRSSRWEADLGRSLEIGRRGQRDATVNLSVFGVIRVAPQHSVLLANPSRLRALGSMTRRMTPWDRSAPRPSSSLSLGTEDQSVPPATVRYARLDRVRRAKPPGTPEARSVRASAMLLWE